MCIQYMRGIHLRMESDDSFYSEDEEYAFGNLNHEPTNFIGQMRKLLMKMRGSGDIGLQKPAKVCGPYLCNSESSLIEGMT